MKKMKKYIITVATHKGGGGKTTITVGLVLFLLEYFDKILLIDMDPQLNLTKWVCSPEMGKHVVTIADILHYAVQNEIDEADVAARVKEMGQEAAWDFWPSGDKKYSVITSNMKLAKVKKEIASYGQTGEYKVISAIKLLAEDYDLVLIDTPPSIETLTLDSVCASDFIIIPVTPDGLAISGAMDLYKEVFTIAQRHFNPDLKILGFVINEKTSTNLGKASDKNIREIWKKMVFKQAISRTQALGELPTKGEMLKPPKIGEKDADTNTKNGIKKTRQEFSHLTREIIERIQDAERQRKQESSST